MPDLKTATKAAIYQSNVAKLDQIGSSSKDFLQAESLTAIESELGNLIERLHNNINAIEDFVVTGKIADLSIQAANGGINLMGNKWLIYQSRGVSGTITKYPTVHAYTSKMPPPNVFAQWIRDKNIRLVNNETYYGKPSPTASLKTDEEINSAAWGMAVNVFKHGLKPRPIKFDEEVKQTVEDLAKQIVNISVQTFNVGFDVKSSAKRIVI